MEEPESYTCHYCKKKFVPKRKRVQKFCSNSCRSGNWQLLNPKEVMPFVEKEEVSLPIETKPIKKEKKKKKNKLSKIDKMSSAGVKNVVAGNAIYELGKGILKLGQKEENKPPTKGDFAEVIKHLGRFHPIENLPPNEYGQKPFFDMYTKTVVYRGYIPLGNPFSN